MKLEGLKPASVLHFSMYDQMIQAAVAGQGVALGRLPLLNDLIMQRKLVTPFKKSVVSPRSYYLFQSDASRKKPEVREFLSWLLVEACRQLSRFRPRPCCSFRPALPNGRHLETRSVQSPTTVTTQATIAAQAVRITAASARLPWSSSLAGTPDRSNLSPLTIGPMRSMRSRSR